MDATNPRVSIAIRAYNQEKEVVRALDSVVQQSFDGPIELLIGIDVSTDNTLSTVQEYCKSLDERFIYKIIAHTKHQGGTRNLISVLKACSGEYIAILDADDYWIDKDKTVKQIAILDTRHDIGLVYGDFIIESPNIQAEGVHIQRPDPQDNVFTQLLHGNFLGTHVSMFRSSLLTYVDFPYLEEKKWSQDDYYLWLEFANHTHFFHLNSEVAVYTIIRNDDSSDLPYEACKYDVSTTEIKEHFIQKYPSNTELTISDVRDMHYKLQFRAARITQDYRYALEAIRAMSSRERRKALYRLCIFRPFWRLYLLYFLRKHKIDNLKRYFID